MLDTKMYQTDNHCQTNYKVSVIFSFWQLSATLKNDYGYKDKMIKPLVIQLVIYLASSVPFCFGFTSGNHHPRKLVDLIQQSSWEQETA